MGGYQPKTGDLVRVVLEGEAVEVLRDGSFWIGLGADNLISPRHEHVASVEKFTPPLPTTPGSLIRHIDGDTYYLTTRGWMTDSGEVSPDWNPQAYGDYFEPIHDAGAES